MRPRPRLLPRKGRRSTSRRLRRKSKRSMKKRLPKFTRRRPRKSQTRRRPTDWLGLASVSALMAPQRLVMLVTRTKVSLALHATRGSIALARLTVKPTSVTVAVGRLSQAKIATKTASTLVSTVIRLITWSVMARPAGRPLSKRATKMFASVPMDM